MARDGSEMTAMAPGDCEVFESFGEQADTDLGRLSSLVCDEIRFPPSTRR